VGFKKESGSVLEGRNHHFWPFLACSCALYEEASVSVKANYE
jgi:hypothetical protein